MNTVFFARVIKEKQINPFSLFLAFVWCDPKIRSKMTRSKISSLKCPLPLEEPIQPWFCAVSSASRAGQPSETTAPGKKHEDKKICAQTSWKTLNTPLQRMNTNLGVSTTHFHAVCVHLLCAANARSLLFAVGAGWAHFQPSLAFFRHFSAFLSGCAFGEEFHLDKFILFIFSRRARNTGAIFEPRDTRRLHSALRNALPQECTFAISTACWQTLRNDNTPVSKHNTHRRDRPPHHRSAAGSRAEPAKSTYRGGVAVSDRTRPSSIPFATLPCVYPRIIKWDLGEWQCKYFGGHGSLVLEFTIRR